MNNEFFGRFTDDSVDKQYIISYSGGMLSNSNISGESLIITETLCNQSQLRFGSCNSSFLELKIINNIMPLKGDCLTVICQLEKQERAFQIGKYKVDSDKPTADRRYRDIIAYDAMYDILHAEVAAWYNSLTFPLTLKAFRDSFLTYMGIGQVDADLPNDAMTVKDTIQPSELSGQTVIEAICEINGCFGHINREGKFQYVFLQEIVQGVYPSNDLYPADNLYPAESSSRQIDSSLYTSCSYEDYVCQRINKLQIRQEEGDIGAIAGTGDNCYIIEDNFLVYGMGAGDLSRVAENLLPVLTKASYRPFSAEAKGNPCIEVGDQVRLRTRYEIVESYVLQRTLKGIQALKDSYTAEGEETCTENVNSVNKSIIQLRGKTNILTRTVEETRLEIKDIEKGLSSQILQTAGQIQTEVLRATAAEGQLSTKITQTAESITSEVTRATAAEGGLSSRITQTAEGITAEIRRATDAENSLSSKITQTAESITSEVQRATAAEGQLSSRITQTAGSITSEVARATAAEGQLSSKITQTAAQVELKVTKGDISSQLSVESGQITIKSNRFVLESTNCSISKNGTLAAKDAEFSGKVTAESGTIGGFTIGKTSIYKSKSSLSSTTGGVYIGTDGIHVGGSSESFKVSSSGDVVIKGNGNIEFSYASSKMQLSYSGIQFGASAFNVKIDKDEVRAYNTYLDAGGLHVRTNASYYTDIVQNKVIFSSASGSDKCGLYSGNKDSPLLEYGGGVIHIPKNISLRGSETSPGSVVLGGYNDRLGFFNSTGTTRKQVYTLASSSSLAQCIAKLNELIGVLDGYGLI